MFLRISSLSVSALLAACSATEPTPAEYPEEDRIACAVAGASELTDECAIERARVDGALTVIVRHPDGGFRRFTVVEDGRGLVAADGASGADIDVLEDVIEVSVDGDRYRIPATTSIGADGG